MIFPAIKLAPTTSAATSETFQIDKPFQEIGIQVTGLLTTETAVINMLDGITNTWVPLWIDGRQPTFNVTSNYIEVGSVLQYQVVKTVTANPVGVYVISIPSR